MLTLHILFQVVLLGKVATSVKGYMIQLSVDWFSSFISCFRQFYIISADIPNFYNFLESYSTLLFEIEKRFLTDSQNPLNNQNLLNVFCQSALSLSSIKPTKLTGVQLVFKKKILWKQRSFGRYSLFCQSCFVNQVWTFSFIGLITWFY